ncbi:MAG: T9SS type A sorting domain-containing protein [Lewinellaceae bacterium]|nr:T9SS type A sorting domain-containing protein [Lewinellaceae bacterium]
MYQYESIHQAENAVIEQGVNLLPNSPNPFVEMTLLWFWLPEATEVSLRIMDSHGRVVHSRKGQFGKGENHIVLQRADIREPGIYLYRIETPLGTDSRRLVMY